MIHVRELHWSIVYCVVAIYCVFSLTDVSKILNQDFLGVDTSYK